MTAASRNSHGCSSALKVGDTNFTIFRLAKLEQSGAGKVSHLPFSLKVLLENLLRNEDGQFVHADDIRALAEWNPSKPADKEISFMPARVLLQDFTGVPAVADLAAMRDAMRELGGDAKKINPLLPAELVIDHSVQVDQFGTRHGVCLQRRTRISAQRRALRVSALGTEGVSEFPGGAAGYGHRATR